MLSLRKAVTTNASAIYKFIFIHHLAVAATAAYYESSSSIKHPMVTTMRKYGFRFYTVWNFILQIIYISLCLSIDITRDYSLSKFLQKLKDFIFVTLLGPCTIFTFGFFWVIYAVNRDLICPAIFDLVFPDYLKHGTHTTVILLFLVEAIIGNHQLPKFKNAVIVFFMYHLAYDCVLFGTYFLNGDWIYDLFKEVNWIGRLSFILFDIFFCFSVMLGIFLAKGNYETTEGVW